jgi:hypothetical protein
MTKPVKTNSNHTRLFPAIAIENKLSNDDIHNERHEPAIETNSVVYSQCICAGSHEPPK